MKYKFLLYSACTQKLDKKLPTFKKMFSTSFGYFRKIQLNKNSSSIVAVPLGTHYIHLCQFFLIEQNRIEVNNNNFIVHS